jgi:single-stranded DNA-binding protein
MIAALISGSLFRAPEQRMSKTGRQFVTTTIRINDVSESRFVNVVAFSESVQSELMRLADGDAVSVQGPLTTSIYTGADCNARIGLSIVANHVLPLRAAPKERKAKAAVRTHQARLSGSWQSPADGPSDDIPFGSEP